MARPAHVRDAVAALLPERHAWTVDTAHAALDAQAVAADRASVHRALTRLADDGVARRFEIDGRVHFEQRTDHHEHVVCEDCGEIGAVEGCAVKETTVPGFTITGHTVTFSGRCGPCSR